MPSALMMQAIACALNDLTLLRGSLQHVERFLDDGPLAEQLSTFSVSAQDLEIRLRHYGAGLTRQVGDECLLTMNALDVQHTLTVLEQELQRGE